MWAWDAWQRSTSSGDTEFEFALSVADYNRAEDAVRKLLWPAGVPDQELAEAERTLAAVKRARGTLRIEAARVGAGLIEWLRFEVELCLPPPALRRVPD